MTIAAYLKPQFEAWAKAAGYTDRELRPHPTDEDEYERGVIQSMFFAYQAGLRAAPPQAAIPAEVWAWYEANKAWKEQTNEHPTLGDVLNLEDAMFAVLRKIAPEGAK